MTKKVGEELVQRMIEPIKKNVVSIRRDFLRPIVSVRNPVKQAEIKCPSTQLLATKILIMF